MKKRPKLSRNRSILRRLNSRNSTNRRPRPIKSTKLKRAKSKTLNPIRRPPKNHLRSSKMASKRARERPTNKI
jgi:hypothetical protein